jgi:GT2 family glycosyltransferase
MPQYKTYSQELYVDSIAFTAYRKPILHKIGLFDPDFGVCGDDGELNYRLKKAGYKLLYTPDTVVYHHRRASLSRFFKQMYRYGWAAARRCKKHPDSIRVIYFMPSLFVSALFLLPLLAGLNWYFIYVLALMLFAYFSVALGSALIIVLTHKDWRYTFLCPIIYFVEHFAYGLGFFHGICSKLHKKVT